MPVCDLPHPRVHRLLDEPVDPVDAAVAFSGLCVDFYGRAVDKGFENAASGASMGNGLEFLSPQRPNTARAPPAAGRALPGARAGASTLARALQSPSRSAGANRAEPQSPAFCRAAVHGRS